MEERKREMNEEKINLINHKIIECIKEFMPPTECNEDRIFNCVDIAYAVSNTLAAVLCGIKSKAIANSLAEFLFHTVKDNIAAGFKILKERENAEEEIKEQEK